MPHPERASDPLLGSADGVVLLRSFLDAARAYASGSPQRTAPGSIASQEPAPRCTPARRSTSAGTPASRQVA